MKPDERGKQLPCKESVVQEIKRWSKTVKIENRMVRDDPGFLKPFPFFSQLLFSPSA